MTLEIQLALPWVWLLFPLPAFIYWLTPSYAIEKPAVRVPWFARMVTLTGRSSHQAGVVLTRKWWEWLLLIGMWLSILAALSRPQIIHPPVIQNTSVRDLMLVVDLSGSMDTQDFTDSSGAKVDRLSAVKKVLNTFLSERDGDRVGLIVFGNAAFVQVPFTQDLNVTRQLLNETAVRMAGPRTAFGDAIGLAITLFEHSQVEEKVLIALTDGNDTGSQIPPIQAAKIAAQRNITLHVVGVGDPKAAGEEALDEVLLKSVAEATGGEYFFAEDSNRLNDIYQVLNDLNTQRVDTQQYRPREDIFYWPLGMGLLLSFLLHSVFLLLSKPIEVVQESDEQHDDPLEDGIIEGVKNV